MVSVSTITTFLVCGLMAQAADPPSGWVVIESMEGPFSFAMPGRPVEKSGESRVANGMMRWKMYTYQKGEEILVFRQQISPPGGPPNSASRVLDVPENVGGVVVTKTPINVRGATGMELITKEQSPTGKGKELSRLRVMEQGPITYTIMARSGTGRAVPPEAAGYFDSIRFDGKAAVAKALAKRKRLGKVDRDDRTADGTLRTFLMAMEAGDEETLHAVTLPDPDFDWLLRGELTTARGLRELSDQVKKLRVERLKQGDRVRITPEEVHVILPIEVGRDRAALKIPGAPAYAPLQLVKGHWKVDPAPLIAARKAAAGVK
jgi:hypothetical protein